MRYPLSSICGDFYRIVFRARADLAVAGALSPEGRFHHDGQPALYLSSRPDWAAHAIQAYVRDDDPERLVCEIAVSEARVLDLRDRAQCARWGADPGLAAIPWLPQRARGAAASTWEISDLARDNGADGLIYTARSEPSRWHLVLFRWGAGSGVEAQLTGRRLPYPIPPEALDARSD